MAAVLCNGIGACCNGLCTILALPFKACGECCKVVGDACGACCSGVSQACTFVFCQSPFTPYVILTLALQIGPIIWSLLTVIDPGEDCGFVQVWIYVFGLLSLGHLVGAFYIAFRMAENLEDAPPQQQDNTSNNATYSTTQAQNGSSSSSPRGKYIWEYVQDLFTTNNDNNNQPAPPPSQNAHRGGSNSWKRFGHLMCYDPGVALYMVLFLAWIIWIPVGISARVSADDDDDEDCERIADYVQNCIICGFIYGILVAMSFCCSMVFLKV